ncbi:unnamed protein product [Moneuplotes crassus]|uniref:RING-type domain-containing protein n=1 Tax=Euplotes crassus TaxID=5936 RepID=A0AAD1UJK1_EUPCR|nr:unnamed protein product [Moneuplotes crassus]
MAAWFHPCLRVLYLLTLVKFTFGQACNSVTYNTCAPCFTNSACVWQQGGCTDDRSNGLLTDSYNQASNYAQCNSAVESGNITLSSIQGETLELSTKSGTSANHICEWIILIEQGKSVEITATRSTNRDEEMVIQYVQSNGTTTIASNSIGTCTSSNYNTTINANVTSVTIRTKILSTSPSYTIVVVQSGIDSGTPNVLTNNKRLVEAISFILVIIIIFILISVLTFALWRNSRTCLGGKRGNQEIRLQQIQDENEEYVEKFMYNMTSGRYDTMPKNYKVERCIICNLKFFDDDNVHITAECLHMFHSHCLQSWYNMISSTRNLACPMCNTLSRGQEDGSLIGNSQPGSGSNQISSSSDMLGSENKSHSISAKGDN